VTIPVPLILQRIQFNIQHIEIRHHFIRDHVNNGDCEIQFVSTENRLADRFTKPLNKERFNFLRNELGTIDFKFVK